MSWLPSWPLLVIFTAAAVVLVRETVRQVRWPGRDVSAREIELMQRREADRG